MWRKGTVRIGRGYVDCYILKGDDAIMSIQRGGVWELYLSRRLIQQAETRSEFNSTIERLVEGRAIVYPSESSVQVDMFKEVRR